MFVLAGLALTSCSVEATAEENDGAAETATYNVDSKATTLEWTGHYLIGEDVDHSHTGTVEVTSGTIVMNGEEFVEGSFTMNMTSINEPNPMSEEMGEKFVGHMNSADYFNTNEFPESTFTLTSFDKNGMAGTLTVLGINMDVEFPATVTMSDNGLTANGEFKLDLASLNLPGLQIDPENPEKRVYPSVDFKLSLVMTK